MYMLNLFWKMFRGSQACELSPIQKRSKKVKKDGQIDSDTEI